MNSPYLRSFFAVLLLIAVGCSGDDGGAESLVEERLTKPVPISINGTSLYTVVSFLSAFTGLDVNVNWYALEHMGINPQTPIKVDPGEYTLEVALEKVLASAWSNRANVSENSSMLELKKAIGKPMFRVIDGHVIVSGEGYFNGAVLTYEKNKQRGSD